MATPANPATRESLSSVQVTVTEFSSSYNPQPASLNPPAPRVTLVRLLILLLGLIVLQLAFPAALRAQSFATIPALNFSKTYAADNPLPQTIAVTSTGATFNFTATATTNTGGSWLTLTPSAYGFGVPTPTNITVTVNPAVTLAAGTYTGQVVLKAATTSIASETITVTLIIHAASETYFDQVAGGLTFSMKTSGNAPPGQALQIRNAGAGSLAWTTSTSTADGDAWLTLSSASGTAPSNLTVSLVPGKLPGSGLTAGTFTGQVLLKSTGDSVSIPITVSVGDSVFPQVNPLNFNKTYAGANPLSQVITIGSTDTQFSFVAVALSSTGGTWLTINPSAYGFGLQTPQAVTVGVNPAVTLAAGTYMAEVIATSADLTKRLSIPVTLTINPTTAAFFDDAAGALDFSMETSGDTPPSQEFQIRNAGTGSLAWTASTSTADGGKWLTVSAASGIAPSDLSVTVDPANIPNGGLIAGTFVGQVVVESSGSRFTIPVSLVVGSTVFRQVNPLNFTKVYAGPNPLPQVIDIASTGADFTFYAVTVNSTGGTWLTINPSAYGFGISTPQAITVSVNPAVTLAAGTYAAEVVVVSELGDQVLTIPVTLTVEAATETFFDDLPGQISFSMVTGGNAPPPQGLPIRNAGTGTLDWTATTNTSDGGAWLSISVTSGATPSEPNVSINPANLPGGGLLAGAFTGQIILQTSGNQVTVPVSVVVGASVFRQINPLNFTMTFGGANPLPQVITVASTGADFTFLAKATSSTGGSSWLTINPSAYGFGISTPQAITVSVSPAATLAAGTYSAQIIVESATGGQALAVPVTLTIEPAAASFFDSLPGQLTFSMVTSGKAPPPQPLEIRDAGAGALAWTTSLSTSDGGAWLAISAASGTAPSVPLVKVIPANLPGNGLIAGTFTGQVILETSGDRVTIPVTMVVGADVFNQVNALDFNKVYAGPNPLPQVVTIASTGTDFTYIASVANSTGGNWLTINPSAYGFGISTPHDLIVTLNPAVTLAAGTYTAEIIVKNALGSPSMVIPVTLTVNPATANFFDDLPGGVSFFQVTGGANPSAQSIPIRNAGVSRLDWTATTSTADGGNWLSVSAGGGTAPSSMAVKVNSANLPGGGLVAGYFNGQIVLTAGTDRQTIPVSVVVGANIFNPINSLSFAKAYGGSNPVSQTLNVASAGTSFNVLGLEATATGGSWLTINPSAYGFGISTPLSVAAAVDPVTTLAGGSYVGEVIFTSASGDQTMVVPVTLTVDVNVATATPTFTPPGGIYTTPQTVTIADSTRGAAIYYTTNGTTPTTASTVYSAPFSVTPTQTVNAIAVAPGYLQSADGKASYSLPPPAATPTFTPAAGTYITPQSVTISDTTTGATIYYTTNGTTPTTASTKYTAAIAVSTNETIKAIAVATGYTNSAVGSATYTITPPAATPVFAPAAGVYSSTQSVTITDTTTGATIYYTTNGTAPTTASTKYAAAIAVSATETIKAIAIAPGYSSSAVATATYTIEPPAATPVFKPAAGSYTTAQSVTITDTTTGATIYYTTNGTVPTTASTKYTAAITVSVTETIKAIAVATGYYTSAVASATYTIEPQAATPVFKPAAGTYTSVQSVTITDATTGATIYYTTNGTTPTTASTKYTAAISVSSTETIKAIAVATGYQDSAVASATYTITLPQAATPTVTQTVTIAEATAGVTVYYTTNGSTPTTSSTKYTGPITLTSSEVLKFIAIGPGYSDSAVRTVTDTVQ